MVSAAPARRESHRSCGRKLEEIEDGVYLILAEEDEVSVEVQNGETWQYQDGGKCGDGT